MTTLERDFLASFDYFAVQGRREGTDRCPSDRETLVVRWAWAWPALAPHVTRLLYDAEHHVRAIEQDGQFTCRVENVISHDWVSTFAWPTLSKTHAPWSAFEAAIVYHAIIRPGGPPLEVTFYRGDGTYVVNGVVRSEEPTPPAEMRVDDEFPCSDKRSLRVRNWIARNHQFTSDTATVPSASGASISADSETVADVVASLQCETCAFTFNSQEHLTVHRESILPMSACQQSRSMATR